MLEQIRKFYWAKPFVPFRIHLADGRNLTVSHPEFMAFGPTGGTSAVYQADGAFHTINAKLVTDVATQAENTASKG